MNRLAAVVGMTVATAVSACGAGAAVNNPQPPVPSLPAGPPYVAAKFSTVVPDGWQDRSRDAAQTRRFAALGEVQYLVSPAAPPSPSIQTEADIVVLQTKPAIVAGKLATYLAGVGNRGAFNVSPPKNAVIDGIAGYDVTYDRLAASADGTDPVMVESEEIAVNYQGVTYDITLDCPAQQFPQDVNALRAVVAQWRWR